MKESRRSCSGGSRNDSSMEELIDVTASQVAEESFAIVIVIVQERICECIVEQIGQRTVEIVDFPLPQIQEQMVEEIKVAMWKVAVKTSHEADRHWAGDR